MQRPSASPLKEFLNTVPAQQHGQIHRLMAGFKLSGRMKVLMGAVADSKEIAAHIKDNNLHRTDRSLAQGKFSSLAKLLPGGRISGIDQNSLKETLPNIEVQVWSSGGSPYLRALRMRAGEHTRTLERQGPDDEFNWGR